MKLLPALALTLSSFCLAQTSPTTEFPAEATTPDAAALKAYLDGRVFGARFGNGVDVRSEFKSRGYLFVDGSNGFRDSGEWRAEDGKRCGTLKSLGAFCNDVRFLGEHMLLRRTNGEVVRYQRK